MNSQNRTGSTKPRIVIVVHERTDLAKDKSFIGQIAQCWEKEGYRVTVLKGTDTFVEADIAVLHVDMTVIPEKYMRFVRRYPVVINGKVKSIAKRLVSRNVVTLHDHWKGPVVVKTDRNAGGNPETRYIKSGTPLYRIRRKMRKILPYYFHNRLDINDYKIYWSKADVPLPVWFNRGFLVEKFTPEMKEGLYCLRIWLFFGDKESNSVCYSKSPIVKSNNIIRREPAGEVPAELREERKRLGFDYGKFDYAMVDGKAVLFDANRTPSLGELPRESMAERFKLLSEGITGFLGRQESVVEIWPDMAEQWKMYAPPLRPSKQDVKLFTSALAPVLRKKGPMHSLILGVTPELYHLPWPKGTTITAVDHTQAMIDHVWPGAKEEAVCAEWTAIPLADGSCDVALCDGGMVLLNWPEEHLRFAREIRRVLKPGGLCLLRIFCRNGKTESAEAVLKNFVDGTIPTWNHLKLRLWLAMQESLEGGIQQKKMLEEILKVVPDLERHAEKIGWPVIHMKMLRKTSDNSTKYFFPNPADLEELMCAQAGGFELVSTLTHRGALGEFCPLITFRKTEGL